MVLGTEEWHLAEAARDARDARDDRTDRFARLAAQWLVNAHRQVERATDDLNDAIRQGAKLPMQIGDRVILDDGDGGFVVRRAG